MKVGERKSERSPLFHHFGEEKGVKRELFGESGESFGERSPLFTPFGESLRKFGESFAENFCENSPRGWWAFEENSLKFAKKTGCPCASPHWTFKQPTSATSIYRASYCLVVMSLCHHAVMSSCRNVIMP
uniref:hypothetical protein n=1 Tax=Prevotella sp. TaxID=59823 RepID=UPI00402A2C3E